MQFKDIVGQRDVINRLTEIIDSGRVSHAQLILGPTEDGSLPETIPTEVMKIAEQCL